MQRNSEAQRSVFRIMIRDIENQGKVDELEMGKAILHYSSEPLKKLWLPNFILIVLSITTVVFVYALLINLFWEFIWDHSLFIEFNAVYLNWVEDHWKAVLFASSSFMGSLLRLHVSGRQKAIGILMFTLGTACLCIWKIQRGR